MPESKNTAILPNGKTPEWAWSSLMGILKHELSISQFDRWIRPAILLGYKDGSFIIGLPDKKFLDWWEDRLTKMICRQLVGIINGQAAVSYKIWEDLQLQLPDLQPGPDEPKVKFKRI